MTMCRDVLKPRNGYLLKLANGQGWRIISTEEVMPWVAKLACIMELKSGQPNTYPRLIFTRREPGPKADQASTYTRIADEVDDLPRDGWTPLDLRALTVWSHRDTPDVICEIEHEEGHAVGIIRMWLALNSIYQRVQDTGGLPFHAALVQRNGAGVLLAAPGDTGKSTCCRRLPPPWKALCDDETLILYDDEKGYLAHPFPTWSDYLWRGSKQTWNVQDYAPLSALFFLEQADADDVVSMGEAQAAISINKLATQVSYPYWRNLGDAQRVSRRKKLFDNACALAKTVPAFTLRVSYSGRFWEKMESVLP